MGAFKNLDLEEVKEEYNENIEIPIQENNKDEFDSIIKEAIKEAELIEKIEESKEVKSDKEVESEIVKTSLDIVLLGKEILKNDIDYVSKYAKIAEQNVKIMNSNYDLNAKVDKFNLSYKLFWIALGVLGTLVFPEVLPYAEKAYGWMKDLRGV